VTAEISDDGEAVVIRAAAGAFGRAVVNVTAGDGSSSKVLVFASGSIGAEK
jgi:NADPH-dependent curcumin reductase CurA